MLEVRKRNTHGSVGYHGFSRSIFGYHEKERVEVG